MRDVSSGTRSPLEIAFLYNFHAFLWGNFFSNHKFSFSPWKHTRYFCTTKVCFGMQTSRSFGMSFLQLLLLNVSSLQVSSWHPLKLEMVQQSLNTSFLSNRHWFTSGSRKNIDRQSSPRHWAGAPNCFLYCFQLLV